MSPRGAHLGRSRPQPAGHLGGHGPGRRGPAPRARQGRAVAGEQRRARGGEATGGETLARAQAGEDEERGPGDAVSLHRQAHGGVQGREEPGPERQRNLHGAPADGSGGARRQRDERRGGRGVAVGALEAPGRDRPRRGGREQRVHRVVVTAGPRRREARGGTLGRVPVARSRDGAEHERQRPGRPQRGEKHPGAAPGRTGGARERGHPRAPRPGGGHGGEERRRSLGRLTREVGSGAA